ncbi:MAG: hypothetical protein IT308_13095 [Anaerolineaceae bacterium]|nr:hypothetical protein [Anaerolineaceae bacterium]
MIVTPKINKDYWKNFHLEESDLEYLYNHLLEIESPQTPQELITALIGERIRLEKKRLQEQQSNSGKIYYPREEYAIGDLITFPFLGWENGKVAHLRPGKNPDSAPFSVMTMEMENGESKLFASGLENHALNKGNYDISADNPNFDLDLVLENYGDILLDKINQELAQNSELIRIAGSWFPRSLLVDVNVGYLNMAEALLDMDAGGPLPTSAILDQIELPTDVNRKLTEFSLNFALQEDPRFDEVGPAGNVLWYLHRLEPEYVKSLPPYLKYPPIEFPLSESEDIVSMISDKIYDELEPDLAPTEKAEEVSLSLLYPHWRAGTLPLAGNLKYLFPTAQEAPRVRFTFLDEKQNKKFEGWMVRNDHYVYGLKEWYEALELMPGSIVSIKSGKIPGEVIVQANTHRPTRDWIRTALVGADGGVVFALLKQIIPADFDERMVIAVPDSASLDKTWEMTNRSKIPLEKTVIKMMRELAKLNPQGHINLIELYAAINIIRRCPPRPLVTLLTQRAWSNYLGDLYFRLDESVKEESAYA